MNAIKQVRDLRNQLAIQNEHIKLLKVNNDDLKRNNDDLKKNNDGLIKRNNELKERNKNQATLIQWMQRQIFGQKSERRLAQATNNQLTLGQILEETSEQPPIKKSVKSYERGLRKKKKLEGSAKHLRRHFTKMHLSFGANASFVCGDQVCAGRD